MSTAPLFSTTHVRCFILFPGARRRLRNDRRPDERRQQSPVLPNQCKRDKHMSQGPINTKHVALNAGVVILAYGLWKLSKGVNGGPTQCRGLSASSLVLDVTVDKLVLCDGWSGLRMRKHAPQPRVATPCPKWHAGRPGGRRITQDP